MGQALVEVVRGDVVESVHRADVAVSDIRGTLVAHAGDPHRVAFLRSSCKPMQALPLIETGAADRFGFGPRELALACASHNAEPEHVRVVQGMLKKIGLGPDALGCGAHAPMDPVAADAVGKGFTTLHSNCSGKHAGFLAVCVHKGWDVATYLERDHPLQRLILKGVAQETGVPESRIRLGTDGCSAPNFALPLSGGARAYARLTMAEAVGGERGQALARLRDAMMAHPYLVAGRARLDTEFMQALAGDVWVKAGAEACFGAGSRKRGVGIVLKVEDGSWRAVGPVLYHVLDQLEPLDHGAADALAEHAQPTLKNVRGLIVGHLRARASLEQKIARAPARPR